MWKIMQESLEDLTSANLWRAFAAELLGTMFLVFFGCGASLPQQTQAGVGVTIPPSIVQISLTFGFIYGTLVWAIGHISGGHINPATSFAAGITRKISIVRCLLYIVAQLLGGMVGAGILFGLTPKISQGSLGVNALNGVSDAQGFGMEVMITFVLVFTILSSIDTKRTDLNGSAPLTIGLAVAVGHLVAIGYTGCSLNPARSFGPAVVMGKWENHWVFWIGPLVGAFLAAVLYEYIFSAGASFTRTRKFLIRSRKQEEKPKEPEAVEIVEIEKKDPDAVEADEVKVDIETPAPQAEEEQVKSNDQKAED